MSQPVSPLIETRVLALITRGDTYEDIQKSLARDGHGINKMTISAIKKRNAEALDYMKSALVKHEMNKSAEILGKTRLLLEKKLTKALKVDDELDDLKAQLIDGLIDDSQYDVLSKNLRKDDLSVVALTSLSKEMFSQSRIEEGKLPDKPESPEEARQKLGDLLKAVNDKDEKKLIELIFLDAKPVTAET